MRCDREQRKPKILRRFAKDSRRVREAQIREAQNKKPPTEVGGFFAACPAVHCLRPAP